MIEALIAMGRPCPSRNATHAAGRPSNKWTAARAPSALQDNTNSPLSLSRKAGLKPNRRFSSLPQHLLVFFCVWFFCFCQITFFFLFNLLVDMCRYRQCRALVFLHAFSFSVLVPTSSYIKSISDLNHTVRVF